jgi:hypothetical protein
MVEYPYYFFLISLFYLQKGDAKQQLGGAELSDLYTECIKLATANKVHTHTLTHTHTHTHTFTHTNTQTHTQTHTRTRKHTRVRTNLKHMSANTNM